jgi:hypothetical protein
MIDIQGYEGLYKIDQNGNVFSLKSGKYLKPTKNMGYCYLMLRKDGKYTHHAVHRLVAQNFIPNPENKPQVNHINGIKDDNRLANLEWVTISENAKHAVNLKLHGTAKPCVDLITGEKYPSVRLACFNLNLNYNTEIKRLQYKKDNARFSYLEEITCV